jgi:GNAT superfamily N-acetyltransferase
VPTTQIRPFVRADRVQLTSLVNAHLAAVMPGGSLSVQALLSHLEAEPGEFIVDRWVTDRRTLAAEQDGRIVAAAHLLRYGKGPEVGPAYRDAAEIAWLVCWPDAPFWAGSEAAGWAVLEAAVGQFTDWGASRWYADGSLPVPGVYGVPDAWPHIRALFHRAGFVPGREEVVLACAVADIPRRTPQKWTITRRLGTTGVRFSAELNGERLGYLEVDTAYDGSRFSSSASRADIGNLFVEEGKRRQGVATSLLAEAGWWLRLAGSASLITYLDDTSPASERLFYERVGFEELTRTTRGWSRLSRQDG